MDLGIAGRACVVTGGSRGIGLATARMLRAEGAKVLLVGRDAGRLAEAHRALDDVGLDETALVVVGGTHGGLSDAELVAQAWDLRDLEARYADFVARFADLEPDPADPAAVLAAQVRLVDAWRRFPFLDPQLPAELLPAGWIGARAAEVFHRRHEQWAPAARLFGT